ncbi:FecR family protein [Chitinophaga jiangningensis]|uniref:FecR family protein n=1 Tax=Chitinophaga jiangningensis TaxID=1419482 RepID=A0A1M7ML91_9BACT|nr:FecR family protein [Chitinophaga jiangningensis]SHM91234.1 FecR family protein [Chitinophaga jiangningensis]
MHHPASYYQQLLAKYLEGKCTPEESEELLQWLDTRDSRRTALQAMQEEFERSMTEPAMVPESMSNRVETRLLQEISKNKVVPMHPLRRKKWMVAAAVMTGVAVAAGFYMYTAHRVQPAVVKQIASVADIKPGSDKAILTLADGTQVTLDSAGNQVIVQGGTKVKQLNGQLLYETDGQTTQAETYNTLNVPRGGQFKLVLPDGSTVWLNAASSLRYPTAFTGSTRTVEIKGQAYFEVAQNSNKPFIVKAENTTIQVLGTGFDIMSYPDEKEQRTTLVEGAVKVKVGTIEKYLKPGQQVALNNETGEATVHDADVQGVIAWKTGFFEFDNVSLPTILRQLGRWYDLDIVNKFAYNNSRLGGRISRNLPLSEILPMLKSAGADFTLNGRTLIVAPSAK